MSSLRRTTKHALAILACIKDELPSSDLGTRRWQQLNSLEDQLLHLLASCHSRPSS